MNTWTRFVRSWYRFAMRHTGLLLCSIVVVVTAGCAPGSTGSCGRCGVTESMCAALAADNGCASYTFEPVSALGGTCRDGVQASGCSFRSCATFPSCPDDLEEACLCGMPYATISGAIEGVSFASIPAAIARPSRAGMVEVSLYAAGDPPVCRADGSIDPILGVDRLVLSGDPSVSGSQAAGVVFQTGGSLGTSATSATVTFDTSDPHCVAGSFTAHFVFTDGSVREYDVSGTFSAEADGR